MRVSFQEDDKESESEGESINLLGQKEELVSPADSTTSSQFSYQHVNFKDLEEEEEEEEGSVEDLANLVEEMNVSKKKGVKSATPLVWKANFPYILTQWKDTRDRNLVTIEVQLPSGSIPDDYHMELKVRGGAHIFCLHHRVSDVFLEQTHFDNSINELELDNGADTTEAEKDAAALSLARAATVRRLKKTFTNKTDLDKRYIHMQAEIELPMLCEDIFTTQGYQGDYPNCSQIFRVLPTEDENGDPIEMLILIVTLVGVKYEDHVVTRRNTPQRNQGNQVERVRRGGA